ncbi:hypothetical protein A4A49_14800 [Nicotiana attenuata]|uniref:peptidyl-tRNA hydrolase n=1 Tax=Nicotiana attenuata TaxID=49451 RepID=A0A314L4R8_NICAT|nr:hypothetical protein A4A49_14800 [Nicotiana attenuata]
MRDVHSWLNGSLAWKLIPSFRDFTASRLMNIFLLVYYALTVPVMCLCFSGFCMMQVASGSRTVLAVGPGSKSAVDSVTGKQRLL